LAIAGQPSAVLAEVDIGCEYGRRTFAGSNPIAKAFPVLSAITNPIIFNVYVVASLILFALLLFGGLTVILNAGKPEKLGQGKAAITAAVGGFLLVFASYWIIRIIEVITGLNILNPNLPTNYTPNC
jgi:hypothetical protein